MPPHLTSTPADAICSECEAGGDLIVCVGTCGRAFHGDCIGIGVEGGPLPITHAGWTCPDCTYAVHRCFVCKQYAKDADLTSCSVAGCFTRAHTHACARPPQPPSAAAMPPHISCASRISQGSHAGQATQAAGNTTQIPVPWVCCRHECHARVCVHTQDTEAGESGRGHAGAHRHAPEDSMLRCFRCHAAYHAACLPPDTHALDDSFFYCIRHVAEGTALPPLDPSLLQRSTVVPRKTTASAPTAADAADAPRAAAPGRGTGTAASRAGTNTRLGPAAPGKRRRGPATVAEDDEEFDDDDDDEKDMSGAQPFSGPGAPHGRPRRAEGLQEMLGGIDQAPPQTLAQPPSWAPAASHHVWQAASTYEATAQTQTWGYAPGEMAAIASTPPHDVYYQHPAAAVAYDSSWGAAPVGATYEAGYAYESRVTVYAQEQTYYPAEPPQLYGGGDGYLYDVHGNAYYPGGLHQPWGPMVTQDAQGGDQLYATDAPAEFPTQGPAIPKLVESATPATVEMVRCEHADAETLKSVLAALYSRFRCKVCSERFVNQGDVAPHVAAQHNVSSVRLPGPPSPAAMLEALRAAWRASAVQDHSRSHMGQVVAVTVAVAPAADSTPANTTSNAAAGGTEQQWQRAWYAAA